MKKATAFAVAFLLLLNNISFALTDRQVESSGCLQKTSLAAESRLKPFFEKHGLEFQNIAAMMYATGRLRDLVISGTLRQSHIMNLNKLFRDGAVKIDADIKQGVLKSGMAYSCVVFRFEKKQKTINALFIKDCGALTDDDLAELRIRKDEAHYLDYPGLEGVWFVNTYEDHKNLVGDLSGIDKELRERIADPELIKLFDVPQRGKFHREGPTVKHHLQAMLNALNNPDDPVFVDVLPSRYRAMLRDKNNRDFFIWFILLHDIGKKDTMIESINGAISNPHHEERSVELIEKYGLVKELSAKDKEALKRSIRLHMGPFDRTGVRENIRKDLMGYIRKEGFDEHSFDLFILSLFLDMAWPYPEYKKIFDADMARITELIDLWEKQREKSEAIERLSETSDVGLGNISSTVPADFIDETGSRMNTPSTRANVVSVAASTPGTLSAVVSPPRSGSSGESEPVNAAIRIANSEYKRLGRTQAAAYAAAQIIVNTLYDMDEDYHIDNIQTAIDILKIAADPQFDRALQILEKYQSLMDHAGITEDIRAVKEDMSDWALPVVEDEGGNRDPLERHMELEFAKYGILYKYVEGSSSERSGNRIKLLLLPREASWIMDAIRPENDDEPVATTFETMPVVTSVFDHEKLPLLDSSGTNSQGIFLGMIRRDDGAVHPAAIKIGTIELNELKAIQFYGNRLGILPEFYGVVKNDDGRIIGYAMSLVDIDKTRPVPQDHPDELELRKRIGEPVSVTTMMTRAGRAVGIDAGSITEEALNEHIERSTIKASAKASALPSFARLKEMSSAADEKKDEQRLSPEEFFNQDFKKIVEEAAAGTRIIAVYADHLDIDALVSTLTMAYNLYLLMQRTGQADVAVVPVIHGKPSDIDRVAAFVMDKVFKRDILKTMYFGDPHKLFANNGRVEFAQVDSKSDGNWLTIDHHPSDAVLSSGEGSRVEKGASAAMMIYQEYREAKLPVDVTIAWLTLYSIMSDTLNFSENMVGADNIYEQVCELILPVIHLPEKEIGRIYKDFYDVAYSIRGLSPADMLADTKSSYVSGVYVSQRFFSEVDDFFRMMPEIREAMRQKIKASGKKAWIYIGTDVKTRRSYVFSVVAEDGGVDEQAIGQVLRHGCVGEMVKDGIAIFVRPEMLRKYVMENTVAGFKTVLDTGALPESWSVSVENKQWFTNAFGIYSYALDHAAEHSWASVVYYQCRESYQGELRTALDELLSYDDERVRAGASWIDSQPEFVGLIESPGTMRSNDGSIAGVLGDGSLTQDEACGSVIDSYYRIPEGDMSRRDRFFEELMDIILHEEPDSLGYQRAGRVLDEIKGFDLFFSGEVPGDPNGTSTAAADDLSASPKDGLRALIEQAVEKYDLKDISFVFDIDGTLNKQRNTPIDEDVAARLAYLLARGVNIQVITGKSKEELDEYNMLAPLLDILRQQGKINLMKGVVLYTSDGGGRYVFDEKGGTAEDKDYGRPLTQEETKIIERILYELSGELVRKYDLKNYGVTPFIRNFSNLKFNFSPYGNVDKSQYAFEKDAHAASKYSPPRLTREEIAEILIERLENSGIIDVDYIISGSTTIGLVRRGVNKIKACDYILKSKKFVFYTGDETGNGNDVGIANFARGRKDLKVVSVDEKKPGSLNENIVWIGGNMDGVKNLLEKIRVSLPDPSVDVPPVQPAGLSAEAFDSAAQTEAERIHIENLNHTPVIPDKTILCHIVADSILPAGQRNMLKALEQEMRDAKYSEKVVLLSIADPDDQEEFIKEVNRIKAREEASHPGYTVRFAVACSRADLVGKIQANGMQALAFNKEADGDIIQVEGIILALRALQTGSIDNLLNVYRFLTGRVLTAETTDISELARMVLFILPVRKVDVNAIGTINRIIEENIKTAA